MLSDYLGRIAMEPARREAIFARTRAIIRKNLPVLERWIHSHDDIFDYVPPQAGAIAFLRYTLPIGSIPLVDRLRVERSVLVVPGDQFGTQRHLRFGFGSDPEYLSRGLARIDETIAALRRKGRPARRGSPAPERRPARSASS